MLTSKKRRQKRSNLRYAEYYNMTDVFDKLYNDSLKGNVFTNLMSYINAPENIKLAYRTIKRNQGSTTPGVDKMTIKDIEKIPEQDFILLVQRKLNWYKPKPVKRKEIPKPNGKTRPLGIPTMIDRIVQQCILQVLEPICEAKFHERNNGFRPLRSAENAIAQCNTMIQRQHLHFVVDIDIQGFFDNVDHCKLKKQIWNMGIRDKKLLCIISEMLKAPIVMPDGTKTFPTKGTPQGGILSPLLSNIVLNELDWWIASQWEFMPTKHQYAVDIKANGTAGQSNKFRALRNTKLKEIYIVRYADDFKIFCKHREVAERTFTATKMWLQERLGLSISEEKSKIINLRNCYSEFLGYKLKAVIRGKKYIVRSHMADKSVKRVTSSLIDQIKLIQKPKNPSDESLAINLYNLKVIGAQNYYHHATCIAQDCARIQRQLNYILKNRLGKRLKRKGNIGLNLIQERFGKSRQLRFISGKAIVPIGYTQFYAASCKAKSKNVYTPEGRAEIHKNLKIDVSILHMLMKSYIPNRSVEYMDNRISLYSGQYGKCAISGKILEFDEIHCHHIIPVSKGGSDEYQNLIVLHKNMHILLHATSEETIRKYLTQFNLNSNQFKKLNRLRAKLELPNLSLTMR